MLNTNWQQSNWWAVPTLLSTMQCPICNSPFEPEETTAMPFCSERCRLIDMGRWLDEGYSLPHVPDPDDDEAPDDDSLRN